MIFRGIDHRYLHSAFFRVRRRAHKNHKYALVYQSDIIITCEIIMLPTLFFAAQCEIYIAHCRFNSFSLLYTNLFLLFLQNKFVVTYNFIACP